MFSQTTEYALRAIVFLAQHQNDGPTGNAKIAEKTQVPPSYLAKILQSLTAVNILTSKRGAAGGFQLAVAPEELSVLDVVNAVDPIKRITTCPLGLKTHAKTLCPMHARLDAALESVEESLRKSTISELINEPGRPQPLVELDMGSSL